MRRGKFHHWVRDEGRFILLGLFISNVDQNTEKSRLLDRRKEFCKEAAHSRVLNLQDDEYDRLMSRIDLAIFK